MQLASDTVKKVTLELGGKSANIILDDADLEMAVDGSLFGCFFHQGQACESGTRLLVPESSTTRSWRSSSSARSSSTAATRWIWPPRRGR
jgi:acyl-CoA reductase-like NAD-dependent aldehyde dehydrogenase